MIPLIDTGGTARAIGHDIGVAMRDQLRTLAATVPALFSGIDSAEVARRTRSFVDATALTAPGIVDELAGMAEGSGVPFETLFALNASEEVNQSFGRFGCTVCGITQAGSVDGHVVLAHNEDADAGWGDYAYPIRAEPDGGPAFVAFTYAGLLLHQGFNASGVASVGNALYARDAHTGVPKLFQYRRILGETTLEGAIQIATDRARAFGNNHLLANSAGDIVDVEVSGRDWAIFSAGNRFLVHANHFVDARLVGLDAGEDLLNSRLRQWRVERLIDQQWGAMTVEALMAIMADHSNYPKSVCKHHQPESDLDYGTIGSVVIDLTAGALWACAGNPCRAEWRRVDLLRATVPVTDAPPATVVAG